MVLTHDLATHITTVPRDHLARQLYIPKKTQALVNGFVRAVEGAQALQAPAAGAPGAAPATPTSTSTGVTFGRFVEAVWDSVTWKVPSLDAGAVLKTFNTRDGIHRTGVTMMVYLLVHLLGVALVFQGPDATNAWGNAMTHNLLMQILRMHTSPSVFVSLSSIS